METEKKIIKMCGGKNTMLFMLTCWQYGSKELYGDKTKGSDKRKPI